MVAWISNTLPDLSLGAVVVVLLVGSAAYSFVKGILRAVVNVVLLACGVYVGYLIWRDAPFAAVRYEGRPVIWLNQYGPWGIGFLVFWLARKVVFSVMNAGMGPARPRGIFARLLGVVFSVIPSGILTMLASLLIYQNGNVSELRGFVEKSKGQVVPGWVNFSGEMKEALLAKLPPFWLRLLQPEANEKRLKLAKLVATAGRDVPPKAIPVIEQAPMRAVIVDERELREYAREKDYSTLLNHPRVQRAVENPMVTKSLREIELQR